MHPGNNASASADTWDEMSTATSSSASEHAASRYLDHCRQRGQRLGDVKPLALSPLDGWSEVLARPYMEE